MMKITYAEAKKYHRLMWRWLARNPHRSKRDWPGWSYIIDKYGYPDTTFDCFACEMACNSVGRNNMCLACPLKGWGGSHGPESPSWCGSSRETPYMKWLMSPEKSEEHRLFALDIAEAEWFEDATYQENQEEEI